MREQLRETSWRDDGRCGVAFPGSNGLPSRCPTADEFEEAKEREEAERGSSVPRRSGLRRWPCEGRNASKCMEMQRFFQAFPPECALLQPHRLVPCCFLERSNARSAGAALA